MKGEKLSRIYLCVCFILLFMNIGVSQEQDTITNVDVGVISDVGTKHSDVILFCINTSLSHFYSSRPIFRTRLALHVGDSKNGVLGAAAAALDLIKNKEVKAILGPWTSTQAQFVVEVGQKTQVPIISYSETSSTLASIRSPYFFSSTYDDLYQVQAIRAIIKVFGWREVTVVYANNIFGEGMMLHLTDALQEINVRIPFKTLISPNAMDDEISTELFRMKTLPSRVFVIHMDEVLASRVFAKAKKFGLMEKGYVWIATHGITHALSSMNDTVIETMQGVLGIKTYVPRSKELENFKAQWKMRFHVSDLNIFGLRAYDATTALAMAVEEVGTTNLSFIKTDVGRNMSELEVLGVSQYGPTLLKKLSRVQFKGLTGDFHFVNGQIHGRAFEIVNVVGNGEKLVGYWTPQNGLVKKLDQKPWSTNTISTWKDHLRTIIWPGDSTSVPRGWEIPTKGKKLKIGVPVNTFTQFVKITSDLTTNTPVITGFCIEFFKVVTQVMMPYDISYDLVPYVTPDGKQAGNYDDLIYQVYLGKYDAVVGDTTITTNRSSYVDFTLPYSPSGVGLIVPLKDEVKRSITIFLTPLTLGLWIICLLSFFIIGLVVWVLEHRINPDFRGPGRYQASTIIWFAFSIMVFSSRERVLSFWARLVVITWYFIVLVLTQSYTASLASLLTSQQLHPTATNMKILCEKGEPVAYHEHSFIRNKLIESGFSESNLIPFDNEEDCDELLSKGPKNGGVSAVLMEVPYATVFLGQHCNKYKMVEIPFNVNGFGFVFPIGSPLVDDVSRAVLKVIESDKATQLQRAWFKKTDESCPDPTTNPDPNPSESFQRLGPDSFWLLFLVAAIVCTFALLKFTANFLKENQEILVKVDTPGNKLNDLWKKFLERDEKSYVNSYQRCQCSSDQQRLTNTNQV